MTGRNSLTVERLRELLCYDPGTGVFTWRAKRGSRAKGSIAGCIDPDGYRLIGVNYKTRRASRLAWFYMTGAWPEHEIDHEDRDRANDAWLNLRPATHAENGANATDRLPNTTGYRGVVFVKRTGRWLAKVVRFKKQHYFGTYETALQAARAYDKGAIALHGAFASLNFPRELSEVHESLSRQ